jgi:uncharacterized membrane protein
MAEMGPVQLIAVGFGPDAKFEGKILGELVALDQEKTIRVLDLLFVQKDAQSGDLVAGDFQGEELGGIVGALLGFDFEGVENPPAAENGSGAHAFGLSEAQIQEVAEALDPGSSAAFLLIEHVWARDLKTAIRGAGGTPLVEGFLTPEAVGAVAPELGAMAEALDDIEGGR